MADGTALLPFFATDNQHDLNAREFNFTIVAFVPTPERIERKPMTEAELIEQADSDDNYKRKASPTAWNRYATLGYQSVLGPTFSKIWHHRHQNPILFHRLVNFNYKMYIDRDLNVPEKLHAWATCISQPFLAEHSPKSIEVDTEYFTWHGFQQYCEKHYDPEKWRVFDHGKSKSVNSPPRLLPPPATPPAQSESVISPAPEAENAVNLQYSEQSSTPGTLKHPEGSPPDVTPIDHSEDHPMELSSTTNSKDNASSQSDAKRSAFTMTNQVVTHDGAHKLSFKWQVQKSEFTQLTNNGKHLSAEILAILKSVFDDIDGFFYLWEGSSLGKPIRITALSNDELPQYLEPTITKQPATNTIAFGVRFGFTENPVEWKSSPEVKSFLKENNIRISESNIPPSAGKPTVAGYILLKHPSMTHRHKYTQYLHYAAGIEVPYFDLRLHKKSPTERSISHLAVHCGENDVNELSECLATLLSGEKTSIFLPRYTFAKMSPSQVDELFQMHDSYVKSLHHLSLAPLVTNLDLLRTEYFPDGTTVERSTREWALSLRLADGKTSAQCDIVNGIKNKQSAFLMVPAAFAADIKSQVQQYRERLRPLNRSALSQPAATASDPPDVIHITSAVQTNLDFMAKLSSADIWNKAPASVKQSQKVKGKTSAQVSTPTGSHNILKDLGQWPSLLKNVKATGTQPSLDSSASPSPSAPSNKWNKQRPNTKVKSTTASMISVASEDRETVSTQSLTNTARTVSSARMSDLEAEMSRCREQLHASRLAADASSKRLDETEASIRTATSTMIEMTSTVTSLQVQFSKFEKTIESMRLMLVSFLNQPPGTNSHSFQHLDLSLLQPRRLDDQLGSTTSSPAQLGSGEDTSSIVSDGSVYQRSPEKKKSRTRTHEDRISTSLEPVPPPQAPRDQRLRFDSRSHREGDTMEFEEQEQGNSSISMSSSSPTLQHNYDSSTPSPPDAQYNSNSDPAGREDI